MVALTPHVYADAPGHSRPLALRDVLGDYPQGWYEGDCLFKSSQWYDGRCGPARMFWDIRGRLLFVVFLGVILKDVMRAMALLKLARSMMDSVDGRGRSGTLNDNLMVLVGAMELWGLSVRSLCLGKVVMWL
jgi:hypothetical protein